MTSILPLVVVGAAAVLTFDGLGAWAAKRFRFQYAKLCPGSWALYASLGWVAAGSLGPGSAAGAGALVGLVDATLGWRLSWLIGPGRVPLERMTPIAILRALTMVPAMAASFAFLAATVRSVVLPN